jgi:hypothetical protein
MMKNMFFVLCIAVLTGFTSMVNGQGTAAERSKLVGTWRLTSTHQLLDDGTLRPDPPLGPNGIGYIIYSETGRMCAMLANPDRPKWASPNAPTDVELRSALNGIVAYCGTFEVNEKDGYVVHHVEFDKSPNIAGTDRKRFFSIKGDRLVLRPSPLPAGIKDWALEWERVKN